MTVQRNKSTSGQGDLIAHCILLLVVAVEGVGVEAVGTVVASASDSSLINHERQDRKEVNNSFRRVLHCGQKCSALSSPFDADDVAHSPQPWMHPQASVEYFDVHRPL